MAHQSSMCIGGVGRGGVGVATVGGGVGVAVCSSASIVVGVGEHQTLAQTVDGRIHHGPQVRLHGDPRHSRLGHQAGEVHAVEQQETLKPCSFNRLSKLLFRERGSLHVIGVCAS